MASANSALHRGLSTRHIRFIALGSAIGTGLFYGSAAAIQKAGPSVLLAYLLGGAAIYLTMRALGEMAVRTPVSGSFGQYASTYLGRFPGFLTGWSYAFSMLMVCLADVTAFGVYMGLWFPETPRWIWVLSIVLGIGALNLCSVRVFGELEFWLSLLKVGAIVAMIVGGFTLLFFGIQLGDEQRRGGLGNLWEYGGFFPNGVEGMIASFTIVMFAFGGIEVIGITAGEAKDPQRMIPKAINSVPLRILIFYVLTLLILLTLAPWWSIGNQGSPFVQIFSSLGIDSAATVLNIVVISAVVSAINSDIFSAGRMMYGMAAIGQAPAVFASTSRFGVPWMTVLVMSVALLLGVLLNYWIPQELFLIFASLVTFSVVWVWLMILLSQMAMRRSMSQSEIEALHFPVPLGNVGQMCAVVFMLFVFVVLGAFPDTRLALYVGVGWLALLSLAYWIWIRPDALHRGGPSPALKLMNRDTYMRTFELPPATVEAFQRDGAICIRQLFSADEVGLLELGIEHNLAHPSERAKVASQPDDPGWFFEDFCNWQENSAYRRFIFESRVGHVAAQLMGSEHVRLYHDHLLVKEPNTRQRTPWHQDQPYYNVEGQQNCSMWMPVDPVARESTLEFIAGSHQGPWLMPRTFMDNQAKWFPEGSLADLPDIEADRAAWSILGWDLQPGDAVFFHMLTLHAAGGVGGDRRRRAFSLRFLGEDMRHTPRPWRTSPEFPGLSEQLPAGAPLQHELFPQIWPRQQA